MFILIFTTNFYLVALSVLCFLFWSSHSMVLYYKAFHRLKQYKFPDGGSVLGSSQFSILPQLPPNILLNSKVVKINPKIIILLRKSKSMTHLVLEEVFLWSKKRWKLFMVISKWIHFKQLSWDLFWCYT